MIIAFLLQDTGRMYGAERATLDLIRGLRAAGVDCRAWLIEERRLGMIRSELQAAIRSEGLGCSVLPVAGPFSAGLLRRLKHLAHDERATAVHTIGPKATVHAVWALAGRGIPLVSTVHGWLFRPDLKERFYEWLELRAFRRLDRVITLSRHYEQWLTARLGAGRVVRIPSGFDVSRVISKDPGAAPAGRPTFGMLGRLSWEKNHELFFRAARRFLDQGGSAHFLVAGEGGERGRLERLCRMLGLENMLELAGYLPSDVFFHRVHVLVQCSRMENLPYSMMEAMARERPILATRVGGLPDLVEDGVTGFLVAPGDGAALAERMARLAGDRELAARMGKAGRAKLEKQFSPQSCVRGHMQLYGELAGEGKRGEE